MGRCLLVHLLDFLSALIDVSEIPDLADGLDLLALRNIPKTPSYKLLGWLDILCVMEAHMCKILRYHIESDASRRIWQTAWSAFI